MSAVSQSYPNYLGGLNEQPDELKKPGQLVEALNVIPDPTIGLCRRPGFKQISQLTGADPLGTWFNFDLDQHYIGCINLNGVINVWDEGGNSREVKILDPTSEVGAGILPHKRYNLSTDAFIVSDDENKPIQTYTDFTTTPYGYFVHSNDKPLKYCVSKNHIVIANPSEDPVLTSGGTPTSNQEKTYYSYINLKLIDTENYNYSFKRFYGAVDADDDVITFNTISEIDIPEDNLQDMDKEYATDFEQPWNGVVRNIVLEPNDSGAKDKEDALIRVEFSTRIYSWKSNDGDGYPQRVVHSADISIINGGKGFKKGTITKTIEGVSDGPDVDVVFDIEDTNKVTSVEYDTVTIDTTNNNDADSILAELSKGFDAVGINKVITVGNGLYLENNIPFSVSTSEPAVADVMNSQRLTDPNTGEYIDKVPIVRVNTVSELPIECYEGFLVQVRNSFDGTNDYYLKYKSESTQAQSNSSGDVTIQKADGYWEEVAKPYEPTNPKNYSMPHLITAVKIGDTEDYAFIVSRMLWEKRTAGDISDNPSIFVDDAKVNAVEYYKNRLFLLTDIGTVVSSRAGEINNLHINTALRTSPIDPIDVTASTSSRVPINSSAVVNNGLVLFGTTEQYSLSTQGDLLTSDTVNVTKISNYTSEPNSYPIYLGTNIGFVSSGLTRFYEMTNVYDRGPVDINERSQQVQIRFGKGFDMPVSSREQSQVITYKRYTGFTKSSPDMMLYRFRQESSQDSSQTSWVQWQLGYTMIDKKPVHKKVAYVTMPSDKMYVVAVDPSNRCYLWLMDSSVLEGLPATGLAAPPRYKDGYTNMEDGEDFDTVIKFPTIYAASKDRSDVTANLTIHRVKMSTAAVGAYNLTIERNGYDTYKLLVEQTPADEYNANFPQLYGEKIETVPVYTRNKNLTLTMSTSFDAPLTLQSMTWEGDYNRPYYKSV